MRRVRSTGILGVAGLVVLTCTGIITAASGTVSQALIDAFRHGDAAALQPLFPSGGRVQLALDAAGIAPGNYSPKQAVALLEQAFQKYQTVSFDLDERSGAIRCEWVIRRKNGKDKKRIVVYVSVQTRNKKSVITSIQGRGTIL